jgi:hypothetical protein
LSSRFECSEAGLPNGFAGSSLQVTLDLMFDRIGNLIAMSRPPLSAATMAVGVLLMAAGAAWPQAAPPQSSPPASPPSLGVQAPEGTAPQPGEPATSPAQPAHEDNPGLLNEIGKMFDKLPTLKSTGETIDDLNTRAKDAAKDATDTLSRLATPSMVSGRLACPVSANGAPDCKAAADKLCQTKGFKEGKSLTTDSAESCSAKVLIPGRTRKPDDCRTNNFVTRALCQ